MALSPSFDNTTTQFPMYNPPDQFFADQPVAGGHTGSSIASDDDVELEAMRKEDSSWHRCQVSLCRSGVGLILDYANSDFKDIITKKEEALIRLRVRSVPVQGDDCSKVQEGDHVLATTQSQCKGPFFDAQVHRVRHSKRLHCRCTFTVKWLHQEPKRNFTVCSSSILKLAIKKIITHPTVSAFISAVKTLSCSYISPLSTIASDMDDEINLHDYLENQLEAISFLSDVSKPNIAEDILSGVEGYLDTADKKEKSPSKTNHTSKVLHIYPLTDQNDVASSAQSWNKMQADTEVKDPPQPTPLTRDSLKESRSPLNPLAARAAFASLMYSICHEEKKIFRSPVDVFTKMEVIVEASTGTKSCMPSVVSCSSVRNNDFSRVGGSSVPSISKSGIVVKSTSSKRTKTRKLQVVDASFNVLVNESGSEINALKVSDFPSGLAGSIAEKKTSQPTRRLTHSAAQSGLGVSDDIIDTEVGVGETIGRLTTSGGPGGCLTRNKLHKEEVNKVKENTTPAIHTNSCSSEQIVKDHGNYMLKNKIRLVSQINDRAELLAGKDSKRILKKEASEMKNDDKGKKTCIADDKISNTTKRLTRSATKIEPGNKAIEVTAVPEENDFSVMESNVPNRPHFVSSPILIETTPTNGTQRRNKRKTVNADNRQIRKR